jgi:uncharacterized cupin superfamily protein
MAKKIDPAAAEKRVGCGYPSPFDEPCNQRERIRLGGAAGLTQFGVNKMTLRPGAWSSQRHWHSHEDEFVIVLQGEVVLVTDDGEQTLIAGDSVGFPAGKPDGHHLQNRSTKDAIVLEVGTSNESVDTTTYPDVDMLALPTGYVHRDGTPYPTKK